MVAVGKVRGARRFKDAGLRTLETFTVTVDPVSGQVPASRLPPICSQADADRTGSFKYLQHATDSLPPIINHFVKIKLLAGEHRSPGDNFGPSGQTALWVPRAFLHETQGWDFTSPGFREFLTPAVIVEGTISDVETGVAGNFATSTTFVRSSGTWTPSEHKGRFIEVSSGAGAGYRLFISDNDATTLYFAESIFTTGAATIKVYTLASVLMPKTPGGAATTVGIYAFSQGSLCKYHIQDVQLGDPANRIGVRFKAYHFEILDCVTYGGWSAEGSGAWLIFHGGVLYSDGSFAGQAAAGIFAAGLTVLQMRSFYMEATANASYLANVQRGAQCSVFSNFHVDVSLPAYTGSVFSLKDGSCSVNTSGATGTLNGNANASVFSCSNAVADIRVGGLSPDTFGHYLKADNSDVRINGVAGTGIDIGFSADEGSSVIADVPTASFTTAEAEVDGTQSSGELVAEGDEVVGPGGSSVLYR